MKVTTPTTEAWQAIAAKLGLSDEDLAAGLSRALEDHGGMDVARRSWSAAPAKPRSDHRKLLAHVTALGHERDGLTAAIAAVRDTGIAKVRATAEVAREEVSALSARFRELSADAAELEKEVAFARALAGRDRATWSAVAPETWVGVLHCLDIWADANLVNLEVPMPDEVGKVAKGINEYKAIYGPARVALSGLVTWLAEGLLRCRPVASTLRTRGPGPGS